MGARGPGGQEIGGGPGGAGGSGRVGSGRVGSGRVNSRLVIIIFETENLFSLARGGYSANHLRNSSLKGGGGLRFQSIPPLPSRCRGRRGGLKSPCEPVWVAGCKLDYTRLSPRPHPASVPGAAAAPPVPREPDSSGGHVHAEALPPSLPAYSLCRPCPQVPASLHAPASCSAWRPGAGLPPAACRCPPVHGPAADAHALGAARMAWISPAPMTASLAA